MPIEVSGEFRVSYDAASQRPYAAAAMADVIAGTEWMAMNIALVFAALFAWEEEPIVLDVYFLLREHERDRTLHKLLVARMTTTERKAWKDLKNAIRQARELRNDFAHGLWAVSDDHEADLILVNRDAAINFLHSPFPGGPLTRDDHKDLVGHLWTKEEFEIERERMRDTNSRIAELRMDILNRLERPS